MNRPKAVVASLLCVLPLAGLQGAEPLHAADSLKLPDFEKVHLENGAVILLIEQRELPLVSFELIVKAGTIIDPAGKEGVASLTADLLRQGTASRSADQVSVQLDSIGARFSLSADRHYTRGSAEFMSKDLAQGMDLLLDVLLHPTFPQGEFDKLSQRRIGEVRSDKDNPQGVLTRYFFSYLYGRHPYHRPVDGDEESLARISRSDVQEFHRVHYTPSNLILAVAGDFEPGTMKEALEKRLGGWTAAPAPQASVLKPKAAQGRRLLLVDKPDATQTFFAIGNVGIERRNPDRVQVNVVNTLFGGRFTSMLNSELRIKSGLTYGAGSRFIQYVEPGPFLISSFTPTATTAKAIDMTLDILRKLHEEGISEEQLQSAKNYIQGQYPPSIETADQVARLVAELEYYGIDRSEVDGFYEQIDAMTVEDAARVIKAYFPMENLTFALIGNADAIREVVRKYADQVDSKSISAPGF